MFIKVILACFIAEALSLCPIGFEYDKTNDKCQQNSGKSTTESCPNCILTALLQNLTRRQINNVINPSKADVQLLVDKLKYSVKSFVDSEGMIDTYLCPTAYRLEHNFNGPPADLTSEPRVDLILVIALFGYRLEHDFNGPPAILTSEWRVDLLLAIVLLGKRYDFEKKICTPPQNRRYLELQPVNCSHCNMNNDVGRKAKKRWQYEPEKAEVDLFELPIYAAAKQKSLSEIIENVARDNGV